MAALGLGLLLIGFGFKMAAVPFHMWAPDVYDGSPTPVTGFMATGVKAAAFAALVRVLMEAFPSRRRALAAGGRRAGDRVDGAGQPGGAGAAPLKRMLAYSSIAHAGYLLVGGLAGHAGWARVRCCSTPGVRPHHARELRLPRRAGPRRRARRDLDDIAGLGADAGPGSPSGSSVCMLSLLGFPGTFGFIGKWYIITAVVAEGQMILPVILVLTSVVSAGYYLPVIMAMYMKPAPTGRRHAGRAPRAAPRSGPIARLGRRGAALGFWPGGLLDLAGRARDAHADRPADRRTVRRRFAAGRWRHERPRSPSSASTTSAASSARELTPELARALGRAFASVAWERLGRAPTLAVGRDNRPSGPQLLAGRASRASSTPAAPRWTWARCPTPALYFAVARARHRRRRPGHRLAQSRRSSTASRWCSAARRSTAMRSSGSGRSSWRSAGGAATGRETQRRLGARGAIARRIVSRHQLARPVRVVVDCGNGVGSLDRRRDARGARRRGHAALLRVGRHLSQPPSRSDGAREPARSPGGGAAHGRRARASRSTATPTGSARWTRPARSSSAISCSSSSAATPCAASARARRSSST